MIAYSTALLHYTHLQLILTNQLTTNSLAHHIRNKIYAQPLTDFSPSPAPVMCLLREPVYYRLPQVTAHDPLQWRGRYLNMKESQYIPAFLNNQPFFF